MIYVKNTYLRVKLKFKKMYHRCLFFLEIYRLESEASRIQAKANELRKNLKTQAEH